MHRPGNDFIFCDFMHNLCELSKLLIVPIVKYLPTHHTIVKYSLNTNNIRTIYQDTKCRIVRLASAHFLYSNTMVVNAPRCYSNDYNNKCKSSWPAALFLCSIYLDKELLTSLLIIVNIRECKCELHHNSK